MQYDRLLSSLLVRERSALSHFAETKGARGSVTIGSLQES